MLTRTPKSMQLLVNKKPVKDDVDKTDMEKQRCRMADHMAVMAEREKVCRKIIELGLGRQAEQYGNVTSTHEKGRIYRSDWQSKKKPLNIVPPMAKPMMFISTNDTGEWQISPEATTFFSTVKCPVSVVSIVGKYRTGKSYLMNRLFERNSGFALGSTVQSKTKGIWVWARPHPQDSTRCLVLLDTEGLHDVEKGDETNDMQLFTFAVLLSNCLVYNAIGTFDDVIVQQLQLVAELTEKIKIKSGSGSESEETGTKFSLYFPSFFLVLRDFFLELEIEGKEVTSDEYLEHTLKPRPGNSRKVRDYNLPRDSIRLFFPRRHCVTLTKPVDKDEQLRYLDEVKESDIRPEFLQKCKALVESIYTEAGPFMIDGNIINGPRFVEIAQVYVGAVNEGGVPCIESTVELLKKNECKRALDEATALYKQKMETELVDKMPMDSEPLSEIHKRVHNTAVQHYRGNALVDESGEFAKQLVDDIEKHFQTIIKNNESLSREKSMQVLQQCFKQLSQAMTAGTFTKKGGYTEYKHMKEQAIRQFKEASGLGPMSENVLNEHLQHAKTEETTIIQTDKALDMKEKEVALEQEKLQLEQEKRSAMEREQREMRMQVERQQTEYKMMLDKMHADFEEREKIQLAAHRADMAQKEIEQRKLIEQGLGRQAEQFKLIMDEMKQDREKMDRNREQRKDAYEDTLRQQAQMIDALKEKIHSQELGSLKEEVTKIQNEQKSKCIVM